MAWMSRGAFGAYLAAVVTVSLIIGGAGVSAGEDVPKKAPTPALGPEDPRDRKVEKQLDRIKVSFAFTEKPLSEACDTLATLGKVNIVLDETKVEAGETVTLKLSKIPLKDAIILMTELAGLHYVVRDGGVFISDEEGVRGPSVRGVYEVGDMVKPGLWPKAQTADGAMSDLVGLIKIAAAPGTWEKGSGNSITGAGENIVVVHTREAHRAVGKLLADLRRIRKGVPRRPVLDDPRDRKVVRRLGKIKVSFAFTEKPLSEACDTLATLGKINIVLDKAKVKAGQWLTLKLTDVPLRAAIQLVTELSTSRLHYVVRNGVVFISDGNGVARPPVRGIYNVADILKLGPWKPGLWPKARNAGEAMNELVDLMKRRIAPVSWDEGSGNCITGMEGSLVVVHVRDVHRYVQEFLADLRRIRNKGPRIRVVENPEVRKLTKRLDKITVSFAFDEVPVSEAFKRLAELGKVGIVLDEAKVEAGKTVTLKLADVSLKTAIKLITEQVGLGYAVYSPLVFISDWEGVRMSPESATYDVADFLKPRLGGSAQDPEERQSRLMDLIKMTVAPGTWGAGSGNWMFGDRLGAIGITNDPETERSIRRLLENLRRIRRKRPPKPIFEDPRDRKVREQLDTVMVSFTFEKQPARKACEVLATLSKVNVVLVDGPEVDADKTATLTCTNVSLRTAVKLVGEQLGLKYVVRDGVVILSDAEGVEVPPVLGCYDAVDLLKPGSGEETKDPDEALAKIVDLIKKNIAPGTWYDEKNVPPWRVVPGGRARILYDGPRNAAYGMDGTIVVLHSLEVHRMVQQALADLRRAARK